MVSYLVTNKLGYMKNLILRTFSFALFSFLLLPEIQAQRGRGRDRDRDRDNGRRRDYVHPNSYWSNNHHYRNNYRGWGYNGYRVYNGRSYFNFNIGRPRAVIQYGGVDFQYSDGYYYRPYGSVIRMVSPPIGIRLNVLPRGYHRVYAGSLPYYYYGGAYYRDADNNYEVVDAPLGASIPELPSGAKAVVINGQKLYELNGSYYKEDIRNNSEIWYTVVGKQGRVDTEEAVEVKDNRPAVGEITDKIPDNCKTVVINGNKYFVSPSDVYYEEVVDGKNIRYKVVGK
jgi:hypothetical protein